MGDRSNASNRLDGIMRLGLTLAFALGVVAGTYEPARGQGLRLDRFAADLLGEWRGEGIYDGNRLALKRLWTLELGEQFLKADMRVSMPNGAAFGAYTYWKTAGDGVYEVVWMDGTGRAQTLHAIRDPGSGVVSANFFDELAEGGPGWRRWEFEASGPDSYLERLFAQTDAGWELQTEFAFERLSR